LGTNIKLNLKENSYDLRSPNLDLIVHLLQIFHKCLIENNYLFKIIERNRKYFINKNKENMFILLMRTYKSIRTIKFDNCIDK